MNTVETKNSLRQDTTVNSEQSQFTSTDSKQKQASTSFVSQFESSTPKKEKNTTVKLSAEDVHVYYGDAEAIKGIDLQVYERLYCTLIT